MTVCDKCKGQNGVKEHCLSLMRSDGQTVGPLAVFRVDLCPVCAGQVVQAIGATFAPLNLRREKVQTQ